MCSKTIEPGALGGDRLVPLALPQQPFLVESLQTAPPRSHMCPQGARESVAWASRAWTLEHGPLRVLLPRYLVPVWP